RIREAQADTIHVATEGPLGLAARAFLTRRSIPVCPALHTKVPGSVSARTGWPPSVGYAFLRWFHGPAESTLVTTLSHKGELERWGLQHLVVWGRGVDTACFTPRRRTTRDRPKLLYVGRIAVEKNLEAFLNLHCDAAKVVVGGGGGRGGVE